MLAHLQLVVLVLALSIRGGLRLARRVATLPSASVSAACSRRPGWRELRRANVASSQCRPDGLARHRQPVACPPPPALRAAVARGGDRGRPRAAAPGSGANPAAGPRESVPGHSVARNREPEHGAGPETTSLTSERHGGVKRVAEARGQQGNNRNWRSPGRSGRRRAENDAR